MVTLLVAGGVAPEAFAGIAELRALPAVPLSEMRAALEAHPTADGILIAPEAWPTRPAPATGARPLPRDEDLSALDDDDTWDALVSGGLERPWRWLCAALDRYARGGAVTIVVPRRAPRPYEGPDEAVVRATLRGYLRALADRTKGSATRVNLVELAGLTPTRAEAELIASIAAGEARVIAGQVLGTNG